jgi:TRAP-type C4-dicarboxylate transport system permease small subunit
MGTLIAIDEWIYKLEIKVSEILLGFIVLFVFAAALLRWFGKPRVWSVDLAQLLFVWICFIGADIAMRKDRHIGVDLVTNLLPVRMRTALGLLSCILAMVFLGLVAVYGARLAVVNAERRFSGMSMSYSWATSSAPVGCLLMIRTLAQKCVGLVRKLGPAKEGK